MPSQTIQFIGKDNLLEGYDLAGIPTWAVWQQKNLLLRGEDRAQLEKFLDMLQKNGSQAVYTICLYDCEAAEISNKTEYNASYGFKLGSSDSGNSFGSTGNTGRMGYADPIMSAIYNKMAAKIGAIVERELDGEPAEKPPTPWEIISGHLSDPSFPQHIPAILSGVGNLLKGIMNPAAVGSAVPVQIPMPQPGKVAGFTDDCSEETATELSIAIDQWARVEPDIVGVIKKLAAMATTDPDKYKMAKTFL